MTDHARPAGATGPETVGIPVRDPDPRRLGPWELVRRLGSGGTSVVHLAHRE